MVFVTSETQGDIHVFIPDALDENIVREVAFNFRYATNYQISTLHVTDKPGLTAVGFDSL